MRLARKKPFSGLPAPVEAQDHWDVTRLLRECCCVVSVYPIRYFNSRLAQDTAAGVRYAGLSDGLAELRVCASVSRSDVVWVPEMPWMTGYFTFAVWASIWMGCAHIALPAPVTLTKKCD